MKVCKQIVLLIGTIFLLFTVVNTPKDTVGSRCSGHFKSFVSSVITATEGNAVPG